MKIFILAILATKAMTMVIETTPSITEILSSEPDYPKAFTAPFLNSSESEKELAESFNVSSADADPSNVEKIRESFNGWSAEEYLSALADLENKTKSMQDVENMNPEKYIANRQALHEISRATILSPFSPDERRKLTKARILAQNEAINLDLWLSYECNGYVDSLGFCDMFSCTQYTNKARSLKDIFTSLLQMSSSIRVIKSQSNDDYQSALANIFQLAKNSLEELGATDTKYWISGDRNEAKSVLKDAFSESEKMKVTLKL